MTRKPAKTADDFTFSERDANDQKENKRSADKEFFVERDKSHGLYVIRYTAGGEVPDTLKGRWTNLHRAEAAIDSHLAMRKELAAA
jgi:hypothetical protein